MSEASWRDWARSGAIGRDRACPLVVAQPEQALQRCEALRGSARRGWAPAARVARAEWMKAVAVACVAVASRQEEEEESLKCVGSVSEGVRVRTPQGG